MFKSCLGAHQKTKRKSGRRRIASLLFEFNKEKSSVQISRSVHSLVPPVVADRDKLTINFDCLHKVLEDDKGNLVRDPKYNSRSTHLYSELERQISGFDTGACTNRIRSRAFIRVHSARNDSELQWTYSRKALEVLLLREEELIQNSTFNFTFKTHQQRLAERLERLNLEVVEMQGDGNCQFRSLAYELYGDPELHLAVRGAAVDHIRRNKEQFAVFLGQDFDEYCARMSQSCTWGDELTLRAICDEYGALLHVLTSDAVHWHITYLPLRRLMRRELFLIYIAPIHYNCVRRKSSLRTFVLDMGKSFSRTSTAGRASRGMTGSSRLGSVTALRVPTLPSTKSARFQDPLIEVIPADGVGVEGGADEHVSLNPADTLPPQPTTFDAAAAAALSTAYVASSPTTAENPIAGMQNDKVDHHGADQMSSRLGEESSPGGAYVGKGGASSSALVANASGGGGGGGSGHYRGDGVRSVGSGRWRGKSEEGETPPVEKGRKVSFAGEIPGEERSSGGVGSVDGGNESCGVVETAVESLVITASHDVLLREERSKGQETGSSAASTAQSRSPTFAGPLVSPRTGVAANGQSGVTPYDPPPPRAQRSILRPQGVDGSPLSTLSNVRCSWDDTQVRSGTEIGAETGNGNGNENGTGTGTGKENENGNGCSIRNSPERALSRRGGGGKAGEGGESGELGTDGRVGECISSLLDGFWYGEADAETAVLPESRGSGSVVGIRSEFDLTNGGFGSGAKDSKEQVGRGIDD